MRSWVLTAFLAATVLAPQAAFSQEESNEATEAEAEAEVDEPNFGALDIDILVHGGLGGLAYPHIEPGVDIGLIPIGDDMALSVGGGIDFGWCAFCAFVDLVSDLNISSTYYSPQGRVSLHLGTLFDLIPKDIDGWTLDPYVALVGGPAFYTFAVKGADGGNAVDANQVSLLLGPALGLRVGFLNNRLLLLGEYRWMSESSFTTVTVRDESGATQTITADDFSRGGNDFILGIGLRI